MMIKSVEVLGDSGKVYTVSAQLGPNDAGEPTCTCPSYVFRGDGCKHIEFVANAMATSHA